MVAAAPSAKPGATLIPGDRTADKFENDYLLQDRLQSGSYGVVWTTAHKTTHDVFAVKVIDRTKLKQKADNDVYREVKILSDLMEMENIVKLMDFYQDPQTFCVVQFYAKGGDVYDRLAKRTSYNEADARNFAETLLQTMKALHDLKLCHRDMKPENLLLRDAMDETSILVADFGFAAYVPEDGLKTRCGTPAFVAPEVLTGNRYTEQVDMWSVGCLLFWLIGGYYPFRAESCNGLFRKIRAADFTFHDYYWKNVSVHAKQVISKLLTVDPAFRLTAGQALNTTWLEVKKENLSTRDLSTSLTEFKKFHAKRTLKSAMHAVRWSVHTAFRHEKVSDLAIATDEWDDQKMPKNGDTAKQTGAFNLSSARGHKSRFEDVYELGNKIHSGSFAVVKECLHKKWNQKYAVKIIKRVGSKSLIDEAVLHEVAIMNHLDHPHIVNVVDFFEEPEYYFIVMELMAGGDLFDRIVDMEQYTEMDARDLAKILLEAVDCMHVSGVAHRDLKPANLLLQHKDDNAIVKIGDFGDARRVHTPMSLTARCGTPSYVAPEILKNQPYDQSCDMWSVGVILYEMLCGRSPFRKEADSQEKMFERIKHGDWKFDEDKWGHISKEAKDLILCMLVANPEARTTAADALRSKWINQDANTLSSRDLSQSAINIRERRPRLKDLARTFMALGVGKALDSTVNPIQGEDGSHQLL